MKNVKSVMAKKETYAGQPYLEVFSAQSCEKDGSWKLSSGDKIFDNSAKSFVWVLNDNSTKLLLPSANKSVQPAQSYLKQRYLIFQIFIAQESDLSIDLGIRGQSSSRRIALSTSYRRKRVDTTLAQLPLAFVQRATWMNLCIDISSLVAGCWEKDSFKSLDSLTICSSSSHIRRILTTQFQPPDTTSDGESLGVSLHDAGVEVSAIPKQYQFGADVTTQIINMAKVVAFEAKSRPTASKSKKENGEDKVTARSTTTTSDKKATKETSNAALKSQKAAKPSDPSLADTARLPPPSAGREKTSSAGQRSSGTGSRAKVSSADVNAGQQRAQHAVGGQRDRKLSEPTIGERLTSAESQRGNYSSLESSGDKESIRNLNPHPPTEPSTDRARRRPKVCSAGKDKGGLNSAGSREHLSSSATSSASSSRQNSGTGFRLDGSGRGRDWYTGRMRRQSSGKDTEESSDASVSESAGSDLEGTATATIALRSTITSQYGNTLRADDGLNSEKENEASSKLASKVYMFASKPRSPKMCATNAGSVADSLIMDADEYRQAKADSRAHRVPRRNNRLTRTEMSPAAEASSEEENTTPRRQRPRRQQRTPRSKNNTPRDVGPVPLPSSKLPEKSGVHGGPLRQSGESMSRTLVGSPTGCNVSRKSLREISRKKVDELRASVGQRPYDPQNYQVDEADELEQQMLLSIAQSRGSSSDDGRPGVLPSTLNYGDSSSDSGSDEHFGDRPEMKGTKHASRHNYYTEMGLKSQDICALSDPRMLTKMRSPPIRFPSENSVTKDANPSKTAKESIKSQKKVENDNLYVVYDPDLKVYFDPRTHKYYELQ